MDDPHPVDGERSFEEELENLERMVRLLEGGGVDLEESLRHYESGLASLRRCRDILERSRRRIEILTGTVPPPEAGPSREGTRSSEETDPPEGSEVGPSGLAWRPLELPESPEEPKGPGDASRGGP